MGNNSSNLVAERKISFEDMQKIVKNPEPFVVISTLSNEEQGCLIYGTVPASMEEAKMNALLKENRNMQIIIYGKNANDESFMKRYVQLSSLGFNNVYIYTGGMFEWLLLQDIFGNEEFPTTNGKKCVDIFKFKAERKIFGNLLLQ